MSGKKWTIVLMVLALATIILDDRFFANFPWDGKAGGDFEVRDELVVSDDLILDDENPVKFTSPFATIIVHKGAKLTVRGTAITGAPPANVTVNGSMLLDSALFASSPALPEVLIGKDGVLDIEGSPIEISRLSGNGKVRLGKSQTGAMLSIGTPAMLSVIFTGSGPLHLGGNGTYKLEADATHSGGTIIGAPQGRTVVMLPSDRALGDGFITLSGDEPGIRFVDGRDYDFANEIRLDAPAHLDIPASAEVVLRGVVTFADPTVTLAKTGGGSLLLAGTGANTPGALTVAEGMLSIGANPAGETLAITVEEGAAYRPALGMNKHHGNFTTRSGSKFHAILSDDNKGPHAAPIFKIVSGRLTIDAVSQILARLIPGTEVEKDDHFLLYAAVDMNVPPLGAIETRDAIGGEKLPFTTEIVRFEGDNRIYLAATKAVDSPVFGLPIDISTNRTFSDLGISADTKIEIRIPYTTRTGGIASMDLRLTGGAMAFDMTDNGRAITLKGRMPDSEISLSATIRAQANSTDEIHGAWAEAEAFRLHTTRDTPLAPPIRRQDATAHTQPAGPYAAYDDGFYFTDEGGNIVTQFIVPAGGQIQGWLVFIKGGKIDTTVNGAFTAALFQGYPNMPGFVTDLLAALESDQFEVVNGVGYWRFPPDDLPMSASPYLLPYYSVALFGDGGKPGSFTSVKWLNADNRTNMMDGDKAIRAGGNSGCTTGIGTLALLACVAALRRIR